jgi:hypothetical protein
MKVDGPCHGDVYAEFLQAGKEAFVSLSVTL